MKVMPLALAANSTARSTAAGLHVVRYGKGHDALSLLATVMADGGPGAPRWMKWLGTIVANPLAFMRSLWPFARALAERSP